MSSAALAVLGIALGVTFTADTGSATISVTGTGGSGSSTLLFPVATGNALPDTTNAYIKSTASLVYTGNSSYNTNGTYGTSGSSAAKLSTASALVDNSGGNSGADLNKVSVAGTPNWTVATNSSGTVVRPGDLAVIDADQTDAGGATSILVTVYVTNLSLLQHDYSSFAWPVHVYLNSTDTTTSNCTVGSTNWTDLTSDTTYLTNTTGYVSFSLATGTHCMYDITMDAGGAFYTVDTTNDNSTGSLGPEFFYTAQAIS